MYLVIWMSYSTQILLQNCSLHSLCTHTTCQRMCSFYQIAIYYTLHPHSTHRSVWEWVGTEELVCQTVLRQRTIVLGLWPWAREATTLHSLITSRLTILPSPHSFNHVGGFLCNYIISHLDCNIHAAFMYFWSFNFFSWGVITCVFCMCVMIVCVLRVVFPDSLEHCFLWRKRWDLQNN